MEIVWESKLIKRYPGVVVVTVAPGLAHKYGITKIAGTDEPDMRFCE